jgi:hypothetical protein
LNITDFHCLFCKGINSPDCAYIKQSIERSLKKQWSEKLDEFYTEEIEWETFEEREHVMEAWRGLLQADGS